MPGNNKKKSKITGEAVKSPQLKRGLTGRYLKFSRRLHTFITDPFGSS